MKYCVRCVQPDTRPDIYYNEDGVCGACLWEDEKQQINWNERLNELQEISAWAKNQRAAYDCVIGVSGGKDSTRQAIVMRDEMGLRPLLVSSEPYKNTAIGFANIENLKSLGFDVISMKANAKVVRKLLRKDFFSILNPNRVLEYCLHSSAYIIADKFDIPLVVNGENPGQTLGLASLKGCNGDATAAFKQNTVKEDYKKIYVDDEIKLEDLYMFSANMERVAQKGIRGVWLSNHLKDWGEQNNAKFSIKHGLTIRDKDSDPYQTGRYRRFACLDHNFISVNNLLKYIKFGFSGATDESCYDVRHKNLTREEAIFLVKELDKAYSQEELSNFCKLIDISENEFWEHANTFRGVMWEKIGNNWQLKNPIWKQEAITGEYTVKAIMQQLGI